MSRPASERTLLMISQAFPPRAAAGTFRVLRFTRFLPEHGWRCIVLTPQEGCHAKIDAELLGEIHPGTWVERFPCGDPAEHCRRRLAMPPGRLSRWTRWPARATAGLLARLCCPDSRILGRRGLYRAAARILARQRVDAVWITSPPFSHCCIAERIKRRFGVPVVLDLRDPWTTNPLRFEGVNRWRLGIERRQEKTAFSHANRVVLNTPLARRQYQALYPDVDPKRWDVLTNGFDPGEFDGVAPERFKAKTLVHGGRSWGVRNAKWMIEAMGQLRIEGTLAPGAFMYVSYGRGDKEEHAAAGAAGVQDMIEFRGNRSHEEVLASLLGADALLLIVGHGHDASIPGKVYEYLATGRPIILAGPTNCAAAELMAETGAGPVVALDDVAGLTHLLRDLITGRLVIRRNEEAVRRYESQALSRRLAEILDALANERGEALSGIP